MALWKNNGKTFS